MSLHVNLSPEAQARLAAQKRNSTISAVLIAVLGLALIGLILALISLVLDDKKQEKVITYAAGIDPTEKVVERKVNTSVDRRPSAPSSSQAKAIASDAVSPVAIPVPEIDVPDPSQNFGMGDDFGEGWGDGDGDGDGGGGGFAGIPSTMQKRCTPEERLQRLAENGGTPECEEAVVKGLRWMKENQQEDGSWNDGGHSVAMTGLSLLAYLGHCETPISEEFGDSCMRAIVYLIANSQSNGGPMATSLAPNHWVYEHAVATYALAEAYTFCKQLNIEIPNLKETVDRAGQLIIDKQHTTSGGWEYKYDQSGPRGGDLSIAGWHIQALKACRHTGLEFTGMRKCLRNAEDYVKSVNNPNGGFGYSGPSSHGAEWGYDTLTGVGVLSLQMMDAASSREARAGLRYIVEKSKFDYKGADCDLYAHYYEGQACMNRGGKVWKHYNELFRDEILKNQAADGSWNKPGGAKVHAVGAEFVGNAHYRTCLATLMLEVYYRFLPGTGKKAGGRR